MAKKPTYLENIEWHLFYGQPCKNCNTNHAKMYAVTDLGKFTMVTFRCEKCGNLQDTTYNTIHYNEAMQKIKETK